MGPVQDILGPSSHAGELWEHGPDPCPETLSHRFGLGRERKYFFLVVNEILEMEESALPDILVRGCRGVPAELHFVPDNSEFLVSVKENHAVKSAPFSMAADVELRALLQNLLC